MKHVAIPMDAAADLIRYFAAGQHAFIACNEAETRDRLVSSICTALDHQPLELIDGRNVQNLQSFATDVVESCARLLSAIGSRLLQRRLTLSAYLEDAERGFQSKHRQGYLIVNHIDRVIDQQRTFEIEGAFREVMQFYDDVAILWLGSNRTIQKISQDDRPFYMSFRIFWI